MLTAPSLLDWNYLVGMVATTASYAFDYDTIIDINARFSDVDICVKIPRELSTDTIAFNLRQLRKAMLKKRLTTYARTNLVARPNMKVRYLLKKIQPDVDLLYIRAFP